MKHQNGSVTIAGVTLAVLVVIGAGTGYYYYSQNIAPQRVLAQTASQITDPGSLASFKYEGSVEGQSEVVSAELSSEKESTGEQNQPRPQTQSFSASFEGLIDRTDPENVEGRTVVNLPEEDASAVKLRLLGPTVYFNSPDTSAALPGPSGGENQWIFIDTSKKQGGAAGMTGLGNVPDPNQTLTFNLSSSDKEELKSAFRENQFVAITDVYGNESIKGVESKHYGYEFRKDAYIDFLNEAQSIFGKEQISDESLSQARESVQNIEALEGEVWIGTQNKYPTKLVAEVTMSEQARTMINNLTFSVTMSEHNSDFTVEEPENAKSLNEIMQGFFTQSGSGAPAPSGSSLNSTGSENSGNELSEERKKQLFEEYEGSSSGSSGQNQGPEDFNFEGGQ